MNSEFASLRDAAATFSFVDTSDRVFPYNIRCSGHVQVPYTNHRASGTYAVQKDVSLGGCILLQDAFATAESLVPHVNLIHGPGSSSFAPERILIRDPDRRLVVSGWLSSNDRIMWYAPVACDIDEQVIHSTIAALITQGHFEQECKNRSTRQGLWQQSYRLTSHLVDPRYRAEVAKLLKNRSNVVFAPTSGRAA